MHKYQIIPRKFRPTKFGQVAGQKAIVTTIQNALVNKRAAQSYLFCGTRGCGKTTLARLFARALNCESLSDDGEPCGTCSCCIEIINNQSLDVLEIDGASNRGIDDIRKLNETAGYAPQNGTYRIYIIDEVHMLTKEAFNALLKTLEEPNSTTKFFFATTEAHKVPSTILSRCQRFNLERIPKEALIKNLKGICSTLSIEIEPEAFDILYELSEGSLRDAQSLLDQLICFGEGKITTEHLVEVFGLLSNATLKELDEAIRGKQVEKASQIAKELYLKGQEPSSLIDQLLSHYHLHLLQSLQKKSTTLFAKNQVKRILDTLLKAQQVSSKTPFQRVHLEMLLINMVESAHQIAIEDLVDRLVELEKKLATPKASQAHPVTAKEIGPVKKVTPPLENKPIQAPSKSVSEAPKKKSLSLCEAETFLRFAAVELGGSVEINPT